MNSTKELSDKTFFVKCIADAIRRSRAGPAPTPNHPISKLHVHGSYWCWEDRASKGLGCFPFQHKMLKVREITGEFCANLRSKQEKVERNFKSPCISVHSNNEATSRKSAWKDSHQEEIKKEGEAIKRREMDGKELFQYFRRPKGGEDGVM
ncbi:hypothetical protein Nepgr_009199 [Nepenthes gracilis]|uniref:Uncharacterized protein n=1 Tax=Nepenthes gracilis TaxID=150966 RepID=A0AAD3SAY4_NEPGR|nr:hypothetical protein Nepgr_009199 [Nepenthes gracilis]